MKDENTSLKQAKEAVDTFVRERDWNQFHSPKNLSMDIAVETSELMEYFLWIDSAESNDRLREKREEVEHEVADVFIALLAFCNQANIDLAKVFEHKLQLTKEKYPVDKVKGKFHKYTEYK